jgi:hypothetical protein
MKGWTMTVWRCVCGREHAPWWNKTVQAPTCNVIMPWLKTYSEKVPR